MKLPEEGSICKAEGRYRVFWKEKGDNREKIPGIGLAIRATFLQQLTDLPTCINEWLVKPCFPLNPSHHVTVITTYSSTMTSNDKVKDNVYKGLDCIIKSTPPNDKLLLLEDYNVRVSDNFKNLKRMF